MAAYFQTFGPLTLERKVEGVSERTLDDFWSEAPVGVCDAAGVYIICSQHGSSVPKPWYIGQTHSRFESRFRQHLAGRTFEKIAAAAPNGPFKVFLIAWSTPKGAYKRSSRRDVKAINELEFALIGTCLSVNKKLINVSESKFLSGMYVPGYRDPRPGKPSASARHLSKVLKLM